MPTFDLRLAWPDGRDAALSYDPETSALSGAALDFSVFDVAPAARNWVAAAAVSPDAPGRKTGAARVIKISLGFACNRACGYCNQAGARAGRPDPVGMADADGFVSGLADWWDGGDDGRGGGTRFELWGGEPLVHWAKLVRVAEAVRERWPRVSFSIITNGDLLDAGKVDWLDRMGFAVGLSHDGPGQYLRGSDPLDDPRRRTVIRDLMDRLAPEGRFSFNCVLTARHYSLVAVERWIAGRLGVEDVPVVTEGLMFPYDAAGMMLSPRGGELSAIYKSLLGEMIAGGAWRNGTIRRQARDFAASLADHRPIYAVGQKCAMDREDHIAVDLKGRAHTCQNTAGSEHRIGHVSNIAGMRLRRARHHGLRPECRACPVVQLCQGACMFLEGDPFRQACDNSFAYYAAVMAGALFHMTGGGMLAEIASRDGLAIRGREPEQQRKGTSDA